MAVQTILDQTTLGHDGTTRDYDLTETFTLERGAIGDFLGPISTAFQTYKGEILTVTLNGVVCERAPGPTDFPIVLPFDCDVGGPSGTPVLVGLPEWALNNGAANTLDVTIRRHGQPPEDSDRYEVITTAIATFRVASGGSGTAPIWTWGRNDEGQGADGTLVDIPLPRESPDVQDAREVWAGGTGPGPRALVLRDADRKLWAAGQDPEGTLFTRSGDPKAWTKPTMHSLDPSATVRDVWGIPRVSFGADHAMLQGASDGSLYGLGADDDGQQGTGGAGGGAEPIFALLPTDDPTDPWPYPAGSDQMYAGDGFTLVSGGSFGLTAGAYLYAAGDAALMGDGGNRFTPLVLGIFDQAPILPNGLGESSGAGHAMTKGGLSTATPTDEYLASAGRNDYGQCGGGGPESAAEGWAAVPAFWPAETENLLYVSCGWAGTSVLLNTSLDYPDDWQLWSVGYPHPLGDAAGLGDLALGDPTQADHSLDWLRIPLPDLSRPNDIPPPNPADYDYPGGDADLAADQAAWEARPPTVYDVPQWVQHGRGHRLLLTAHAIPDPETGHDCYDVWTQGWNDRGQRGDGGSAGHQADWSKALSLYAGDSGNVKTVVAWDTNYAIGWECVVATMIPAGHILVG